MGFGAIAGLAGSVISAGVGIAGDLSKGGGPNLGGYSSTLNKLAQQYVTPFAGMNNPYWQMDLPGMARTSIDFGIGAAPSVNQANMLQLQYLLNTALPGYGNMINQMQTNTGQLLGGQVPSDVQNQILRNAAQVSMTGGIGPSNIGNISARGLGLTSLDLQERGFTQGSNLLQMTRNYLMPQPVNPLTLLPLGDIIQGTEWTKEAGYQANLAAYTAEANAAAARVGAPTNQLAGIGGDISGLVSALGKTNPQTGKSGFDLIGGLFGGGGGGGAGGGGGLIDLSGLSQGTTFGY